MTEREAIVRCAHSFIKITATTYDIPVPYLRCAKCGAIESGAHLEQQGEQ